MTSRLDFLQEIDLPSDASTSRNAVYENTSQQTCSGGRHQQSPTDLELLDQFPAGLELKDVATKTGINKSTAYRFLSHLESECYLLRNETGAFTLGPKTHAPGRRNQF